MTTQTTTPNPAGKDTEQMSWRQRTGLFILFLICGLAILFFGSNYFDIFPTNKNLTYNLVIAAVFLVAALWLRFTKPWNKYWQIAFAFFVASVAYPVTLLFADQAGIVLNWLAVTDTTSKGMAIAKVYEVLVIVIPILALTKLSGADLGSIYLKRGDLKLGLSIGALIWFNFATSAFLFFATRFTSLETLGAAFGWGLVFSFANGFMEELWLRGIFLRRFAPALGISGSVWLTSIVFALLHGGVTYLTPIALPFMVANTLTLGLACGYLIMKTDNLWGAVLIHAAADLFLFIAMLSNA